MSRCPIAYYADEIYVNAEFAGHRGAVQIDDESLTFVRTERIHKQWTPLAESYQLDAVKQWHPLDRHGSLRVNCTTEYIIWMRNCIRLDPLSFKPRVEHMKIDFLTYHARLDIYEDSPLDRFHVRFRLLLGWNVYEEIGQVVHNPASLARVNFTP